MDGVKISINQDNKKEGGAKKRVVKKRVKTKSSKTRSSGGSFLSSVFVFLLTALIVGGAIYAWQNRQAKKSIDEVRSGARNARIEMEKRMENLKNKLSTVKKKIDELQNENKKLSERVKLLNEAHIDYDNPEIGISFSYPALFGEVELKINKNASSTKFVGTFTEAKSIVFGGVNKDYVLASSSDKIDFFDNFGYLTDDDKYYFLPAGETESKDYELIPVKIIKSQAGEVLVLNKSSFLKNEDKDNLRDVNIGENLGALVNLSKENYMSLTFLDKDFGVMPQESFESMLKTIKLK